MVKKEKESPGYKPKLGETIICHSMHGHWEAKVLEIRKDPNSTDKNPPLQYFVHYQNWNKKWDEWITDDVIYQYNDANITLLTNYSKTKKGSSAKKKSSTQQNDKSNLSTASIQSESKDGSISLDQDEILQLDQEIKIKFPDLLKNWLVDDDNCIKNKKLHELPARPTISTILKDFINHKKIATKTPGDKEAMINELTLGIKDYFNVMLGSHLLYKFERLQYQDLLKKNPGKDLDLTNHYGVIHLIRLMTKIGKPLSASILETQNIQTIINYIQDLMVFISKQNNLFDIEKNYMIAPPEYIKNASK